MKSCQVCSIIAEDSDAACFGCGEASWSLDVVADAPKAKAKKQKTTKPVVDAPVVDAPVVDAPSEEPVVSDAEFAAELTTASDADLLALKADPRMPASWLALLDAEIAKRGEA